MGNFEPAVIFDLVLGLLLIGIAWHLLTSRDLFKSVVLFIVLGLLMSVAWVRLNAPDIALAEAAIGAGLTGALLLEAVRQMGDRPTDSHPRERRLRRRTQETSLEVPRELSLPEEEEP
jgi:energy-converting hydrogenase B subunit D